MNFKITENVFYHLLSGINNYFRLITGTPRAGLKMDFVASLIKTTITAIKSHSVYNCEQNFCL